MKKFIGILVLASAFALLTHFQVQAAQATQTVTVTITEAQLNQRLTESLTPNDTVNSSANVVIEQGQLALRGKITFNFGDDQPTTITFSYNIKPFVKASRIACAVTAVQFGDRVATADDLRYINTQAANEACDQLFSPFLAAYPNGEVTRVVVADHAVNVQLTLIGQAVPAGCSATTLSNVNLRSGPSASASVITALPTRVTLDVIATQGNWLLVRYRADTGWLYAPLVSKTCK